MCIDNRRTNEEKVMEIVLNTLDPAAAAAVPDHTAKILDDQDAIRCCQRGNAQAFGFLVNKYMQRAYYSALGIVGSHEAAVDLSQDAFVRAWRAIKGFDPGKNFFTWYYRILRNLCFNFIRDKNRHARSFSETDEHEINNITDMTFDTEAVVEQNEMHQALWKGLEQLREPEREIIVLKDLQDYSYKEIAEILDIPIGTVMSRLYHARQALKAQLKGWYS